ncbi:hypothetical protein RvY_11254 [Ramazzottius varieornatus]|uniref:Receptor ligand binding region domain-containing protein n=1 Tax=Ramazzottius varieornatus TaxID=947166 RepID=A0A1D1VFI9_RAMVA|nr:hypothetical protein RvY_11254 [Ramazzottius varieornatus]
MEEMVNEIAQRAISAYNWTIYPQFRHNLLSLSAYETVLNESYGELEHLSGRDFAKRFWSRTFRLPSRDRETTEVGYPVAHIWIKQFDPDTSRFLPVLKYDALSGRLEQCSDCRNVTWPRGTFPPPVVPVCGYHHELCQEQDRRHFALIGALAGVMAVILTAAIYINRFLIRKAGTNTGPWWLLDDSLRTAGMKQKKQRRLSDKEYTVHTHNTIPEASILTVK